MAGSKKNRQSAKNERTGKYKRQRIRTEANKKRRAEKRAQKA